MESHRASPLKRNRKVEPVLECSAMSPSEIQARIDDLQVALSGKGKHQAVASFVISSHAEIQLMLRWQKAGSSSYSDSEYKWFNGKSANKIISEAVTFIARLPSVEVARLREFMSALGGVIELGRKNGIEVDFINPLTETMKRLSENALTDQSAA